MPPSAITAPPNHSSPIPGFAKNRNEARVPFSTVTRDAYRSSMPLKGGAEPDRRRADRLGGRRVQVQGRLEPDDLLPGLGVEDR
jgi:hypothetical protein